MLAYRYSSTRKYSQHQWQQDVCSAVVCSR